MHRREREHKRNEKVESINCAGNQNIIIVQRVAKRGTVKINTVKCCISYTG